MKRTCWTSRERWQIWASGHGQRSSCPTKYRTERSPITNPGNFGGLFGIPIIHQPQVAILALGGIESRAVAVHDAIAVRQMVYLVLSFDHRIVDGAVADQFMAEIKRALENWKP